MDPWVLCFHFLYKFFCWFVWLHITFLLPQEWSMQLLPFNLVKTSFPQSRQSCSQFSECPHICVNVCLSHFIPGNKNIVEILNWIRLIIRLIMIGQYSKASNDIINNLLTTYSVRESEKGIIYFIMKNECLIKHWIHNYWLSTLCYFAYRILILSEYELNILDISHIKSLFVELSIFASLCKKINKSYMK